MLRGELNRNPAAGVTESANSNGDPGVTETRNDGTEVADKEVTNDQIAKALSSLEGRIGNVEGWMAMRSEPIEMNPEPNEATVLDFGTGSMGRLRRLLDEDERGADATNGTNPESNEGQVQETIEEDAGVDVSEYIAFLDLAKRMAKRAPSSLRP